MFQWLQRGIEETLRIKGLLDEAIRHWERERATAAARRADLRRRVFLRLEVLGVRELLSASTDVLAWEPGVGNNKVIKDYNASDGTNWYDVSARTAWSNVVGGGGAPGVGNQIWLDKAYSNAAIIWDQNTTPPQNPSSFSVANILLTQGYTGQQTINAGVILSSPLGEGTSGTNDQVNIKFLGNATSNSWFVQGGGSVTWQSFNLTNGANGAVWSAVQISGGSLTISANAGLTETTQVGMAAYPNASIQFGTPQTGTLSTLTLQNGTGFVSAYGGTVYLYGAVASGTSDTFVNGDGTGKLAKGSEELSAETSGTSTGIVNYQGTGVAQGTARIQDNLNVPVWADGGYFRAYGGGTNNRDTGGTLGSVLVISGSTNDTLNTSAYAAGEANGNSGAIQLFGNIQVQVNNDMNIGNNGYLQTGDNTGITVIDPNLIVGSGGTIAPWYGLISGSLYQFGTLIINGTLDMNGTYQAAVGFDDKGNPDSVVLQVTGTETWHTGSSFIEPLEKGSTKTDVWTINTYGSILIQTGEINHSSGWSYEATATAFTVAN